MSIDWESFVLSTQVNPSYPGFSLESHNHFNVSIVFVGDSVVEPFSWRITMKIERGNG